MNNTYEINKLSKNKNFKIFNFNNILIIDKYISFLKDNLNINHNELLIIVDLTIYNKENKILFNNKDYNNNYNFYIKNFIKMFMYNYKKNIFFLKKYIKIDQKDFYDLKTFFSNKKRIYSYFEDINNTNINFYLPIILKLEYPYS